MMETYTAWLELSDPQRREAISGWDAYVREGFKFVLMAAARLAFHVKFPILDVRVATGHGGGWQILVFVPDLEMIHEADRAQEFEGFPVLWFDLKYVKKALSEPGDDVLPEFRFPGE